VRPAVDRPDVVGSAVWIVLGVAIVLAAVAMDRMENQGGTLYTAPGLVPGLLGLAIAGLGVLLGVRALRGGNGARAWQGTSVVPAVPAQAGAGPDPVADTSAAARDAAQGDPRALAVGLLLCLAYALGLVGRAPFALSTFLFVTAYVAVFEWRRRGEAGQRVRGIVLALVYGAGTALVVSTLFEKVFFVRLP
jgi:hypothetical protein